MSEYQYYEFLAIDRPLTENEIAELRALSTRATITPVSFINTYQWGDFKGNPDKLMKIYFDAHVYVANWMTARFMARLPQWALNAETARAVAVPQMLDITSTKSHWIIEWGIDDSENDERFAMEDGSSWMARLAPVREELLRGDIRSLYIGWLAAVTSNMMEDDAMEPLAMNGLGHLTGTQMALAEFLEVDQDLLAGAGIGSPAPQSGGVAEEDMDKWIDALPRDEVQTILRQLLEGKGQQAERLIRNQFAAWQNALQPDHSDGRRRTVAELWQNAEKAREIRLEQEEIKRNQREEERRQQRNAYLKNLASDFSKAWKSLREPVERGSGRGYDEACGLLVDISEAHALHATKQQFQSGLKKFMAGHLRRKALIERLVKAGLWEE